VKHETLILATAGAVTTTSAVTDVNGKPINGVSADLNGTECDQAEVFTNPVLAGAETVGVFIVSASGGLVPARDVSNAPAVLDATHQSVLLPGGPIYRFVKAATVSPTSLEVYLKPRNK
jgi:hypothetical protein